MMGGELFPILCGVCLGTAVAFAGSVRRRVVVAVVCLAAIAATVMSGEFLVSWSYVFVDAAIVLTAAVVSFVAVRRLRLAAN